MSDDAPKTRTLPCTCKAPPGKHGTGRQRRRGKHDLECELVVYVEKLEKLRDGCVELSLLLIEIKADVDFLGVVPPQVREHVYEASALLERLRP